MADNTKRAPLFIGKLMGRTQTPSPSALPQPPSPDELPPLSDLTLTGYTASTRHRLLDGELAGNIRSLLPPRLQLYDSWELVYSLHQHGISLNTLYRNCNPDYQRQLSRTRKTGRKDEKGYAEGVVSNMVSYGQDPARGSRPVGYVMIIEDEHRNKFGCYLNEHLRATDHKRYYGNGECFLWKCEWYDEHDKRKQRFKAFMYTGINDNIIYSNPNYIAIGSSKGNNGLWIDKSLYLGVSYPCETFGNEILNEQGHRHGCSFGKFKIINLEVWRVGELE